MKFNLKVTYMTFAVNFKTVNANVNNSENYERLTSVRCVYDTFHIDIINEVLKTSRVPRNLFHSFVLVNQAQSY